MIGLRNDVVPQKRRKLIEEEEEKQHKQQSENAVEAFENDEYMDEYQDQDNFEDPSKFSMNWRGEDQIESKLIDSKVKQGEQIKRRDAQQEKISREDIDGLEQINTYVVQKTNTLAQSKKKAVPFGALQSKTTKQFKSFEPFQTTVMNKTSSAVFKTRSTIQKSNEAAVLEEDLNEDQNEEVKAEVEGVEEMIEMIAITESQELKRNLHKYQQRELPSSKEEMKQLQQELLNKVHSIKEPVDLYTYVDGEIHDDPRMMTRNRVKPNDLKTLGKISNAKAAIDESDIRHSYTFGEYTQDSIEGLIEKMKNMSQIIRQSKIPQVSNDTNYRKTFDLSQSSVFLDIGSGLGRPCLHFAIACDCLSIGLELQQNRVQGSYILQSMLYKLLPQGVDMKNSSLSNASFFFADGADLLNLCVFKAKHKSKYDFEPTHIYSYSTLMSQQDLQKISKALCGINFKVLVWSQNLQETNELFSGNLKGSIKFAQKINMRTTGGESKCLYMYYFIPQNFSQEIHTRTKQEYKDQLALFKAERKEMNWSRFNRICEKIINTQKNIFSNPLQSHEKKEMLTHSIKEYEEANFIVNWVPQIFAEAMKNEGLLGHDYIHAKTIKSKVNWFREMKPIIEALKIQFPDYRFKRKIASSISGCVLKYLYSSQEHPANAPPNEYAVKVFFKQNIGDAIAERSLMLKLNKPQFFNIIKPLPDVNVKKEIRGIVSNFIVTPYYLMNLKNVLNEEWSKDLNLIQHLFAGIVRGVHSIHSMSMAHCDLKPQNIVITKHLAPLIIDFGHAQKAEDHITAKGTFDYQAPELRIKFNEGKHDYRKSDCWSLGIILYQMIFRKLPFSYDTSNYEKLMTEKNESLYRQLEEQFYKVNCLKESIAVICPSLDSETDMFLESALQLIVGLLNPKVNERYDINQVKNSSFVTSFFRFDGDFQKYYDSLNTEIRKEFERILHERQISENKVDENLQMLEIIKHLNRFYPNDIKQKERILKNLLKKEKRMEKNKLKKAQQKAAKLSMKYV